MKSKKQWRIWAGKSDKDSLYLLPAFRLGKYNPELDDNWTGKWFALHFMLWYIAIGKVAN